MNFQEIKNLVGYKLFQVMKWAWGTNNKPVMDEVVKRARELLPLKQSWELAKQEFDTIDFPKMETNGVGYFVKQFEHLGYVAQAIRQQDGNSNITNQSLVLFNGELNSAYIRQLIAKKEVQFE